MITTVTWMCIFQEQLMRDCTETVLIKLARYLIIPLVQVLDVDLLPMLLYLMTHELPVMEILRPQMYLISSLVAAELRSLQVIQQTPALTHQFEQAAARGVVLLMGFQVSRQVLDSLSQYGNLHFGRTRILLVQLVV